MKVPVLNIQGAAAGEIDIPDEVLIKTGKGTQAVHDAVVAYQANQRLGTAKTKDMSEVAGSGKKPWRQKGTGRARAGSFASPIWVGGGTAHGPVPRDYSKKVSKKTKTLAFRKAFSERLLAGDVVVVDELNLTSPKTKPCLAALEKLSNGAVTVLVVADPVAANLRLATRNVVGMAVAPADALNVYELLRFDRIIATRAALDKIQTRLAK